jgi:hypothetical protein
MTNMKKPTLQIQEQQPRSIQRADIAPVNGLRSSLMIISRQSLEAKPLRRRLPKNY